MLASADDELSRAVASGLLCNECGTQFVKPHGFVVACHYCYSLLSLHDRTQLRKATHKEANRVANEEYGRKKKQEKMARKKRLTDSD